MIRWAWLALVAGCASSNQGADRLTVPSEGQSFGAIRNAVVTATQQGTRAIEIKDGDRSAVLALPTLVARQEFKTLVVVRVRADETTPAAMAQEATTRGSTQEGAVVVVAPEDAVPLVKIVALVDALKGTGVTRGILAADTAEATEFKGCPLPPGNWRAESYTVEMKIDFDLGGRPSVVRLLESPGADWTGAAVTCGLRQRLPPDAKCKNAEGEIVDPPCSQKRRVRFFPHAPPRSS